MKRLVILVGMLLTQVALAADENVEQAWLRATAPGQEVAGAYMNITSTTAAKLVGASSPAAGPVQLHIMTKANGVMEMHELKNIAYPKKKTLKLGHGGMHNMLFVLQ